MADQKYNILDDYYNATWHWQVKLAGYIVAESAKTSVSIKSASIKTSYTPNFKNHAPIMTSIEMTLFEPMGARLYDNIMAILAKKTVFSLSEARWELTVSFCGYDEDGNPKDNIITIPYTCFLIEISSNVTEQGSEYHCVFAPRNDTGQRDEYYVIPANFQLKDKGDKSLDTVGKFMDKLKETWNDHIKTTYNDELIIYDFKFENWPGDSPASWKITNETPSLQPQRTDIGYNIPKGQGIDSVIHNILCQTKKGVELAMNNSVAPYAKAGSAPNSAIAVVTSTVKINYNHFNKRAGRNQKEITYRITPFQTTKIVTNPDHAQQISGGELSAKVLGWIQNGRLPRIYNYIFSGKNQDVLKLDLKFNGMVLTLA